MNKTSNIISILVGLGAGATLMYFADPDRGHRRRAIARDKIKSTTRNLSKAASRTRRDLANRAYGVWAESKHLLTGRLTDDPIVEERVRSKMGHVASHPHDIKVDAVNGKVTLTGSILADEIGDLLRCVRSVAGVKTVENMLEYQVPVDRKSPGSNVSPTGVFTRQPVIH